MESLLITPEMRGRGLGRKLMVAAEDHVKRCVSLLLLWLRIIMSYIDIYILYRLGYEAVHLSTHDQHAFYKHIGYTDGLSVSGERKCNTNIVFDEVSYNNNYVVNLIQIVYQPISTGPVLSPGIADGTRPQLSDSTPPTVLAPPPPPPPPVKVVPVDENTVMKWYMKLL